MRLPAAGLGLGERLVTGWWDESLRTRLVPAAGPTLTTAWANSTAGSERLQLGNDHERKLHSSCTGRPPGRADFRLPIRATRRAAKAISL
jgi:hypothetical protein